MINKEIQEHIKSFVSKQKGNPYPCSNQIVGNTIVINNSNRLKIFEELYPHFVCYRRYKNGYQNRYINARTEELWQVVYANENSRGFRHYQTIIDSEISEDILFTVIEPCMHGYCKSVEFFNLTK